MANKSGKEREMSENEKFETYWAITGKYGLYIGTWYRRIEAITARSDAIGKSWKNCYRDGDRAIKVKVIPVEEWRYYDKVEIPF